jgi:anti-sigma regulatory factor (Ser/Thr protein kinase)
MIALGARNRASLEAMDASRALDVPATAEGIRRAADALEAFWAGHATEGVLWPFQVALDEVLSNVVRHGPPGSAVRIRVELKLGAGKLELSVSDDGPAYDPLQAAPADTAASLELRPIGGLGLGLVRGLMDAVEYRRAGGRNQLRMERRLDAPPPARPGSRRRR